MFFYVLEQCIQYIYTKNYTNNSTQVILMKANAKQGELTKKAVSDQNKNPHASDTSKFN